MPMRPMRPLAQVRPSARMMGLGRLRSPAMQHRMPFCPRVGFRVPFGPMGAGISSGNVPLVGRMPPRQKILVNPHFRGSPAAAAVQSRTPSTQPATTFPKLMSLDISRPTHQHPQFTVKLTQLFILRVCNFRLAAHLENLEKSGNLTLGQGKVREFKLSRGNCALPELCCRSCDGYKINVTSVLLSKVDMHKMDCKWCQYSLRSACWPLCMVV